MISSRPGSEGTPFRKVSSGSSLDLTPCASLQSISFAMHPVPLEHMSLLLSYVIQQLLIVKQSSCWMRLTICELTAGQPFRAIRELVLACRAMAVCGEGLFTHRVVQCLTCTASA